MSHMFPITSSALRWLEIILSERFGHRWHLQRCNIGLLLSLEGGEGAIFFDDLNPEFACAHSFQSYSEWDPEIEGWRSILGCPIPAPGLRVRHANLVEKRGIHTYIHYDILGLTYWMLARIEEINRADLDCHGRFPALTSHALRHGYLERPVVDEWLDLLGQIIVRQWPSLALRKHIPLVRVSHDVDRPSLSAFKKWGSVGRLMINQLVRHHSLSASVNALHVKFFTRDKLIAADPFNTFDWLMEMSETVGLKSCFNFICGRTDPEKDADYVIEHDVIRDLLRRIHDRGHQIGLHPSYNTYVNAAMLKREADRLRLVCEQEGVKQQQFGGRMHYLRWKQPDTIRSCAEAGLSYDSTLGYADHAGFRCGTCFEYPAFDAEARAQLNVRIRPLIAMDCSVIDDAYMGLGVNEAAEKVFLTLKDTCQRVNGCFELLWHNSYFQTVGSKDLYQAVLQENLT